MLLEGNWESQCVFGYGSEMFIQLLLMSLTTLCRVLQVSPITLRWLGCTNPDPIIGEGCSSFEADWSDLITVEMHGTHVYRKGHGLHVARNNFFFQYISPHPDMTRSSQPRFFFLFCAFSIQTNVTYVSIGTLRVLGHLPNS